MERWHPSRPISIPHGWKDGTPVARSPYLMDGRMAPPWPDLHTYLMMEGWYFQQKGRRPSMAVSVLNSQNGREGLGERSP
ncbi:MAG: hypothetical protein AAFO96_28910 [Bacteroidota bacterium]